MLRIFLTLVLVASPQQQSASPGRDTASVLQDASNLLHSYYATVAPEMPVQTVECRDDIRENPCEDPNWRPIHPTRYAESCSGVTLDDCMRGDWDCVGPYVGDCMEPAERAKLIDRLEVLAQGAGASPWLYRQRVGMAVKHGNLEAARRIALECGSVDWFCPALRGFVEHRIRPGAGLLQFDSAMALAPSEIRCAWRDLAHHRREKRAEGCQGDVASADLFWWLADPLWTRDGNERKAEHFARHVMRWISWGAKPEASIETPLWRLEEQRARQDQSVPAFSEVIALGPANSIERRVEGTRAFGTQRWKPYVNGGYSFAPTPEAAQAPLQTTAEDWALEWNKGDERMATTEDWYNLSDQTVLLRRGSRLRVLAAAAVPPELQGEGTSAEVALGRVADLELITAPATRDLQGSVRTEFLVDSGGYLVSIEVRGSDAIGRSRHGIPAPPLADGFGISDLALVRAEANWEERDPLEILLPSTEVTRETPLGLYFEVYGVTGEDLQVRLSTEEQRGGLWSRITSIFGGSAQAVKVEWTETVTGEESGDYIRRAVMLEGGDLDSGTHQLVLEVRRSTGEVAKATRLLRVQR